jgi:hypothetical protein
VQVIDITNGNVISKFLAYSGTFRGGVRVAMGDMNGDGIAEIIAAQGPGGRNVVRVFTLDGVELQAFRKSVYSAANFTGGVNVAVGDVDGDGLNDIVTSPSTGKAQIRIYRNQITVGDNPFDGANDLLGAPFRRFLAFPANFTGGAVVAVADMGWFKGTQAVNTLQGDGKSEVIVGSGAGMRATVKIFNVAPSKPVAVRTFLPFAKKFTGGISSLDLGRIEGDMIPDIVVGAGEGFGSMVKVIHGRLGTQLASFRAYQGSSRHSAVRAAVLDTNADGIVDQIVTAQGQGGTTRELRSFDPISGALVDSLLEDDLDFTGEYNLASVG